MAIKLADTTRPNNHVDDEHLGTFPVAWAEDIWFRDGTRLSEIDLGGGSLQKEELPLASLDEVGHIYQFIGTTGTYTNGFFYECVENSGVYSWVEKPVQSTEGLLHEASTLPTASASNLNDRYFYTGVDTAELNHGGIYECQEVADSDPTEYAWVLISSATIDLSQYKKIFTGTSTAWEQLTTEEKIEYDMTAFSDEDEAGVELDTAIHFEEHFAGSGSTTPTTKSYTITEAGVYFAFAESSPYNSNVQNSVGLFKNGTRFAFASSNPTGFAHVCINYIITCEIGDIISVSAVNAVSSTDDYNRWGLFRIGS